MTTAETLAASAEPTSTVTPTMASIIEQKITAGLTPNYLEVIDESSNHSVPKGSESHFKLIIVAPAFEGLRTLHCHRRVYAILEQELAGSVHALALHTYTDEQWREIESAPDSPSCRGGTKVEAQLAGEQ